MKSVEIIDRVRIVQLQPAPAQMIPPNPGSANSTGSKSRCSGRLWSIVSMPLGRRVLKSMGLWILNSLSCGSISLSWNIWHPIPDDKNPCPYILLNPFMLIAKLGHHTSAWCLSLRVSGNLWGAWIPNIIQNRFKGGFRIYFLSVI